MYYPLERILTVVAFLGTTLTTTEAASKGKHDEQVAKDRVKFAMEMTERDDGGLEWANVIHDTEHMKEHLEGKAKLNVDTMNSRERAFHYFQQHDTDDNNQLDGLELMNSIMHVFLHSVHAMGGHMSLSSTLDRVTIAVDSILLGKDVNNDGYLTYNEYMALNIE